MQHFGYEVYPKGCVLKDWALVCGTVGVLAPVGGEAQGRKEGPWQLALEGDVGTSVLPLSLLPTCHDVSTRALPHTPAMVYCATTIRFCDPAAQVTEQMTMN